MKDLGKTIQYIIIAIFYIPIAIALWQVVIFVLIISGIFLIIVKLFPSDIEKQERETERKEKEKKEKERLENEREKRRIEIAATLLKYKKLRGDIEEMPLYKNWKKSIFKKYGKICQVCGSDQKLEIHHKISMYSILKNYGVENIHEAFECEKLWDIDNGIVLCHNCHEKMESSKYYNKS